MRNNEPGHYVPKLLEECNRLLSELKKGGAVYNSYLLMKAMLEEGTNWTISKPTLPLVWNTEICTDTLEGMRLPFPSMNIEYKFEYEVLGFDKPNLYKQLVDARVDSVEELVEKGALNVPATSRIIHMSELPGGKAFILISIYKEPNVIRQGVDWMAVPVAAIFPYKCFNNVEKWYRSKDGGKVYDFHFVGDSENSDCPFLTCSMPMYDEVFQKEKKEGTGEAMNVWARDLCDEIRMAFGLLGILSCSNVPTKEIEAPEKLNKKRARSGKPRIPAYRTLHISDHHEALVTRTSSGGHASPRAHWRRGHIRNQRTAKGIIRKWIRPTVVGAGTPSKPDVVLT